MSNPLTILESELLPFPTGEESILVLVNSVQDSAFDALFRYDLIGLLHKFDQQKLFNLDFRTDGTVKVSLNLETPGNIAKLASFIQYINDNNFKGLDSDSLYIQISNLLTKKFGTDIGQPTIDMIKSVENLIKEIVDDHNMYIEKASLRKRESIIKNYITLQLFTIISDPINRRLADSSVDVVTAPAKELAKLSPKATVQNNFTPGNTVNMFLSISENMVGKDGIAICATALKSFFALTELYLIVLNDSNVASKEELLFNVDIGGRHYYGLANGYSNKYKSLYEEAINPQTQEELNLIFGKTLDYLLELFWASDAANEMSALLGLSTDNAKELVLAKINAGISTISMYLYGLSIGVPFNELYRIMTTPLAFRLAELTKGNMFDGNLGTINIVGSLRYLNEEPAKLLSRFDNLPKYDNVMKPVALLYKNILNTLDPSNKKELNTILLLIASKGKVEVRRLLNSYRNAIDSEISQITELSDKDAYLIAYNQLIDFAILYADDVFLTKEGVLRTTVYGNSNLYRDIEMLATGAEEMKLSGKILKVNQKIDTNPKDLLNLVNNIEESIIRRLTLLKNLISRLNINKGILPIEVKDMIDNNKYKEEISKGGYRIDLERFMTDQNYANLAISLYNNIKLSYNLPLLISRVPHYRGYVESLLISYKAAKDNSAKFRATIDRGNSFILDNGVSNLKLKDLVIKNVEKAVDLYTRQTWMLSNIKPIKISSKKDTVYTFIDNAKVARELTFDTEYRLGTTLGDANFKLWMETVMIPKLKKELPNNKFIQDLKPVINTRTNLGSTSVNYGLSNMMPRSDYEQDSFNEYKEAFNNLASVDLYKSGRLNIPILDLFYYYSLIANDGRVGSTSILAIFEDYLQNDIPKSYRKHTRKIDVSLKEYEKMLKFITPEMLVPFSSPYVGGTNIMKYKDKDTNDIVIYKKIKKSNLNDYDDDYLEWEDLEYEIFDPKAEINGYLREFKLQYHNYDNRNYFYNPLSAVEELAAPLSPTLGLIKDYKTLSRFNISVFEENGMINLVDLTSNKTEDIPIILRFKKEVKKHGLPTKYIEINGALKQVVDLSFINDLLEAIENGCI